MEKRIVLHLDMDAFFASVEIHKNPALKGKPVVIGGPIEKRGVVSTCSYEARVYGVRSAMPLMTAKRLCPDAIFIPGDYALYREISDTIFTLFHQFSSQVEETSIDEGYMDITEESLHFPSPLDIGRKLKQAIWHSTGLPSSVGIGPNKMVAKIASSLKKPNALCMVTETELDTFLEPLDAAVIPGIGKVTEQEMARLGIKTIKDLKERSLQELIHEFGARGFLFYNQARGVDNRKVEGRSSPKSIGAETTFDEDLYDITLIESNLASLLEKAHRRLMKRNLKTRGMTLKIRYFDFKTIARSTNIPFYTNDLEILSTRAKTLFESTYPGYPPIRLIGITFDRLNDGWWQPNLF
ncbi:DNA polymerase IV [Estrella lausannensis]|uniref:DNA polymerase IV n=1 Tax=Estrella lausannensis TaxID=483423 RepID=A0A0H5E7B9_9BACT|nr:DNA polymerase IV [Estrella lausannensis]CRX39225.1 DNA polymerase IV [Estrella lausannensis]